MLIAKVEQSAGKPIDTQHRVLINSGNYSSGRTLEDSVAGADGL
jgi:hypothetical protein